MSWRLEHSPGCPNPDNSNISHLGEDFPEGGSCGSIYVRCRSCGADERFHYSLKPGRPGYSQTLEAIKKGKPID